MENFNGCRPWVLRFDRSADATIPTDNGSVSFGNDDYIADLDADNIAHRVDYGSGVTAMEAFNNYYDDMNNSNYADALRFLERLKALQ